MKITSWGSLFVSALAVVVFLNEPIIVRKPSYAVYYEIKFIAGNYNIYGVVGHDKDGKEWVIPWNNIRGFKSDMSKYSEEGVTNENNSD